MFSAWLSLGTRFRVPVLFDLIVGRADCGKLKQQRRHQTFPVNTRLPKPTEQEELMYRAIQTFLVALCLLVSCLAAGLRAQEDIRPLVDALGATTFPQKIEAVKALAASGNPKVGDILQNLSDGKLYAPKTGGTVFLEGPSDGAYLDVLTGSAATEVPGNLAKIRLNNGLRGAIGTALSQLTLLSQTAPRALQPRGICSRAPIRTI